jgi:hypothetical protein
VEAIIKCEDYVWDQFVTDSEEDVNEVISVTFYHILDEIDAVYETMWKLFLLQIFYQKLM